MKADTEPKWTVDYKEHWGWVVQGETWFRCARNEDAVFLCAALNALEKIADYDGESIWLDDRDEAAKDMLDIARKALGREQ